MALDFDSEPLMIRCPFCGNKFEETISRLKYCPKLSCPSCARHVGVNLLELHAMLESARKSMDELLEKLLKFDRGIGRHSGASHLVERRQIRRFDQRPSRGTPNPDEG
ncbi:hypothetical protein SAMN05216420_101465 [Nitrosospira sp. Nl5]|uniref:hypothetical protein n=1 Tax=Nitrosospira sp. Nl5 TaxID=200120 RepID=UPI0008802F19|nr:hypothetical protein [Nitrosospira sp. Nl5]SCX96200.1 hypothetical protein SAMN05216420_101465 [Nitrosospira sp. Nl5]